MQLDCNKNGTAQPRGAPLALACFKATLGLVDHINAPFATDHPAIFMARLKRLKTIFDFHVCSRNIGADQPVVDPLLRWRRKLLTALYTVKPVHAICSANRVIFYRACQNTQNIGENHGFAHLFRL